MPINFAATVGDDNVLGTEFDLERDLGMGDEITVPGGFIRLFTLRDWGGRR